MNLNDRKIWYVSRDDGRGIIPVSVEGWVALAVILFSVLASGVAALVIKAVLPELPYLWIAIFVVVCIGDAVAFYVIAKLKTDTSITISEYRAREARRS